MSFLSKLIVFVLALALLQITCKKTTPQANENANQTAANTATPAPTVSEQELQQVKQTFEKEMKDPSSPFKTSELSGLSSSPIGEAGPSAPRS